MSFYIYSHEALPNPAMMGKARYTPDGDYIKFGGVTLPILPAKTWVELDQDDPRYTTLRRRDWTDRQGTEVEVRLKAFMPIINSRFADRGVVMLDHKPSLEEREQLKVACEELNLKYRKKAVEFFENQRDMAKARQGTYDPTPYIDECYELLGMDKPYSLEAMKEQRRPGEQAAARIAEALSAAQKDQAKAMGEAVLAVVDKLTAPQTATK